MKAYLKGIYIGILIGIQGPFAIIQGDHITWKIRTTNEDVKLVEMEKK